MSCAGESGTVRDACNGKEVFLFEACDCRTWFGSKREKNHAGFVLLYESMQRIARSYGRFDLVLI